MANNVAHDLETIVNTLLLVCDRVIVVARDHTATNTWEQPSAQDANHISYEDFLANNKAAIDEVFSTSKKVTASYSTTNSVYRINIVPVPEETERVLVTIELIENIAGTDVKTLSQRDFYEDVLNHIAADIVVFDAQLRFVYLNPVAIKSDELRKWLIGKTDEDYCRFKGKPLSIAEKRMSQYRKAIDERRIVEYEERSESANGETLYHIRRIWPKFDEAGSLEMIFGYGLNITDRVVTQQALRTSQETFASAFDYSGIGMALVSPTGKWLDVNNEICRITGYSKDTLLKLTFHDITYPEDLMSDLKLIQKMLRREITTYTLEKRCISADKKIVLVSVTASLVWNADDTPKFFIFQVIDITRKKEMEEELNRRNSELEATKNNLVNKVNQLEELSHIIAHNLRGPAANIKTLADALVAKTKGGAYAAANLLSNTITTEEAALFIQEGSESLLNSLATLMEIAEIKLNKEIAYNDCDLEAIISNITAQLHSTIFEKQAVITTDLAVKHINYPKAYLANIVYNLVSNSLKYTRKSVAPEVHISSEMRNHKVVISVKDNGLGIDLKRYSEKVFKLNQVFHHGFDSKGIGLYITKTQVESLGGTIEVKSELNNGCEFIVTL